VTDVYELDAEYVIHAAAMPHYGDGRATEDRIHAATGNALLKADSLDCTSVVLPVLGTGAAGFEFETGAQVVCEEIWSTDAPGLRDVRVIAYSDSEYQQLDHVAAAVRSTME
jgi:O-acetyl-ADP-ribose deacetylase (regulator of RNase III)